MKKNNYRMTTEYWRQTFSKSCYAHDLESYENECDFCKIYTINIGSLFIRLCAYLSRRQFRHHGPGTVSTAKPADTNRRSSCCNSSHCSRELTVRRRPIDQEPSVSTLACVQETEGSNGTSFVGTSFLNGVQRRHATSLSGPS